MPDRKSLSPELLHILLRHDAKAGTLFWRERGPEFFRDGSRPAAHSAMAWNKRNAGGEAFTAQNAYGYRVGRIFSSVYMAHRVMWAMETGRWPVNSIDHIDHDKANNKISNLREVTHSENLRNARLRVDSTSGVTGVTWFARDQLWVASIKGDGKSVYLGRYRTFEDAIAARAAAEIKYGYHKNHGAAR